MAIVGRKPKPEDQRRNQNIPRHEWVQIEDKPFEGGPRLPKHRLVTNRIGDEWPFPWPKATKHWWHAISRMPHCVLWDESDWQFALDTALIAAAFHAGDTKQANELRQREKVMGTTLDSRRDLRIRYVQTAVETEQPSIKAIEDYRRSIEG